MSPCSPSLPAALTPLLYFPTALTPSPFAIQPLESKPFPSASPSGRAQAPLGGRGAPRARQLVAPRIYRPKHERLQNEVAPGQEEKRQSSAEPAAGISLTARFGSGISSALFTRKKKKIIKKTSSPPPTSPAHRPDAAQSLFLLSASHKKKKKKDRESRREEWERGGEREKVSSRSHIGEEAGLAMPLNILLSGSFPAVSRTHPG